MEEREAYGVLIGIQAKIGATSVYGIYEISNIVKAGAEACGFNACVYPIDDPEATAKERQKYSLMITLEPKDK